MENPIHIAEPGDDEGFSLAHFISHLGVTPGEAATFLCKKSEDVATAWHLWQETWFVPHLAPAFVGAYLCGHEQRIDEVQSIDSYLDVQLTGSFNQRSLAAAASFLEGKEEMRGHPGWKRFSERIENGTTPGHVPIVFALQSALYNLSLAPALTAYAWFEFQSGRNRTELSEEESNAIFATVLKHVPVALTLEKGDNSGEPGHLRAI